jgi:RNA-binding protein 23/39
MNGFELAGRPIRVGLGNDKFTSESTNSLLQRFGTQQPRPQASSFSGAGGRGHHAGGAGGFESTSKKPFDKGGASGALGDEEDLGAWNRADLMRKLARRNPEPEPPVATQAKKKSTAVTQPNPSRCVLLKNMYNAAA